jgi:acetyltransferase-like isoleucine patch superfamily enzyme
MSVPSKLVAIGNRLFGKRFELYPKHKYLAIDASTRLEPQFAVDLLVAPEDRLYVKIGARGMLNVRIVFESRQGSVEIGDRVYIGGGTIICREKITIGDDVTMAWGVWLYDHNSQSLDWRQRAAVVKHFYDTHGSASCYEGIDWTGVKSAPIVIEDKVWIGFDAVILKGVRIGEGAVVGARSVVVRDVEPYTVVAGNPAAVVGRIER